MALYFQKTYRPDLEQRLRQDSQSLAEKARRRFAALEAIKRGHGGIRSLAPVLGCDPHPVNDGMRELPQLPNAAAGRRVRQPGGGRKKTAGKHADVIQQGQDPIKDRTAGDPRRQDGVWTELTPQEMAPRLQEQAVDAGPRIVRRLLDGRGCARRQRATVLPGGAAPPRDAPLRHRAAFIQAFLEAGNPLLRIETQTKEGWGTLSRDGKGD